MVAEPSGEVAGVGPVCSTDGFGIEDRVMSGSESAQVLILRAGEKRIETLVIDR